LRVLPELETVIALKDEALHAFGALYDGEPAEIAVRVVRLGDDATALVAVRS
jgi:hypothetical protein